MTDFDWEQTTFDGVRRRQGRALAAASPAARLAVLEELLEIAEASGALASARKAKQRSVDDVWAGEVAQSEA